MHGIRRWSWIRRWSMLAACLVVAWMGACSREPAASPPAASAPAAAPAPGAASSPAPAVAAPSAAPAPAPAAAAAALARQEFSTDPELTCEVLEVRRVSGGALLLKWRLVRAPAPSSGLAAASADKAIYHTWSWSDVYFTDAAENKKYSGLKDSAGAWIGQGDSKHYKAGERQAMWMKFPAPPETSTRITFVFPGFAPFEDLPVAP